MNILSQLKIWVKLCLNIKVSGHHMRHRKDDVFLVSYPKSGNTWMRFVLGNIVSSDRIDFNNVNRVIPDIYTTSKQDLDNCSGRRIIKSHEPWLKSYSKVIYVVRDPRDVVVSYYYWKKKYNTDFTSNMTEFINEFLEGTCSIFGCWIDHYYSWKNSPQNEKGNMMIVKYEDLKQEGVNEIKRVCDFLNLTTDVVVIEDSLENSRFTEMQKLEAKQSDTSDYLKGSDKSIKFVRSMKSEWEQHLQGDLKETFKAKYGMLLIDLGYEKDLNW